MKKISLVLFILIIMLPICVKADTSVSINCSPNEINSGSTTDCLIKGDTDMNISRVTMNVSYGTGLSYKSFVVSNVFTGSGYNASENKIDVSKSNNNTLMLSFNIGTITIQANENGSVGNQNVTLNNIQFFDADGNSINVNSISTSINVKANENTSTGLKTLNVTGGTLSPSLTAGNYGYSVILDSASATSFGLTATANNSSDTITFVNSDTNETITNPNNIPFVTDEGKSSMSIKITVGSVAYTINVTKPVSNTASNELSTLYVGGVNIPLRNGQYDYEVSLISNGSYQVNATLKDSTNYKISNLTLPTSMTGDEFAIVISPKDNSSGLSGVTYTIKVKRGGSNSTNNVVTNNTTDNPQTGSVAITMAVVLIISFALSIYLYKKNIEGYN